MIFKLNSMTSKLNSMTKNKSIQRIPMKHFLVIPPIGLLYYHYKSDRWTGHPTGPVQRYRSGPVWTGRDRSSVRNPTCTSVQTRDLQYCMEGNPHTCLSSVTQILLTTGVTGPSAQCHSDHQCHSQAEHESGPPRIFLPFVTQIRN